MSRRIATAYGVCNLTPLPGCQQVVISHGVFTEVSQRNKGYGKKDHASRLGTMRALMYDCAICTVDETNAAEIHILVSNGWHKVHTFTSRATGHVLGIWVRNIP